MTPALEIQHLQKRFGTTVAVRDLSLTIAPGEIFGLLGPNGAGKSTTINMISGVCRIDHGTVKIFGHDNRQDYRTTRRITGVMHQEIVTDNFFTIDRALKIHAGFYGVPRDEIWRQLLIERLGLGPHLHKPMNKLSGGMKRRFMVAKALIHKPRLLILDEPTAGVDVELRRALWQFVREINRQGTTILLTTHYLEEAEQMCDRIAIMNRGDLVALDRTKQLLARIQQRQVIVHLATPLSKPPVELTAFEATLRENGHTLCLELPKDGGIGALLPKLCSLGLAVRDLEMPRPGLEEVFIALTGSQQQPNLGGRA
jgi:ABC-2 type transport system ATP-binding protein